MKIIERQILSTLDRLHRDLADSQPCRWQYDGLRDTYSCCHMSLTGKEVISRVEMMNHYTGRDND